MIEIPIHHSSWKERIQAAFLFFTRIPLGRFFSPKREAYESAIEHWPLTGWITGLIMGTIIFFCSGILPGIAILLAITVRILITGCLHEDGLIRFLNGMGQRETGRKIVTETMKDHQSSTFGIVGIILYILLLWMTLNRMYPLQAALTVIAADPFCKMLSAQLTMMLPHAANPSNSQDEIAFRKLTLERIIGEVFPENLASARVLEKNGFRLEETKAEAIVKGGKAMDVRVYVKA